MSSEIAVPFRSTRVRWTVRADEVSSDGVLAPSALVARMVNEARLVVSTPPTSVSVEELKVLSPVRAGSDLVITCALERERDEGAVISVAARRGEAGAQGGLAAVGVLHFNAGESASWLTAAGGGASLGATPVEARFKARAGALSADVLGRVHELALVSAQGFVGGPVRFEVVHSLTTLAAIEPAHWLQLHCSVVHAEGARLAVLSHLVDLDAEVDVSCALMSFLSARPVPTFRPGSHEGRVLFHEVGRQLAS